MLNYLNRMFYYGFLILSILSAMHFTYIMFFNLGNTTLPIIYTSLMMIVYCFLIAILVERRPKATDLQKKDLKNRQRIAFILIVSISLVNIIITILACFIKPA
jgi:phosphoglycerol transferase MdoB-like AlkP superfamily enzyme